jgi:hypothetical protein
MLFYLGYSLYSEAISLVSATSCTKSYLVNHYDDIYLLLHTLICGHNRMLISKAQNSSIDLDIIMALC